jgi:hypothetical protein
MWGQPSHSFGALTDGLADHAAGRATTPVRTSSSYTPFMGLRNRALGSLPSRNKFVLQACREALARKGGDWPKDFFAPLADPEDERLLAEAGMELETAVLAHRRNCGAVAL